MSERATIREEAEALERLDREQLQEHQVAQLQPMLAELLAHNPFWRERLHTAGLRDGRDIATLDDFRRLPPLTKAELMADQEQHPPYGSNLTYAPERYVRL